MYTQVAAFLVVVVAMTAAERPPYGAPPPSYGAQPTDPAQYNFRWEVVDPPSGNNYNQEESRDGDNTRGSYFVELPDTRRQTVTYTVNGDSGYVAEVVYEGEAQFPEQNEYSKPQPPRYQ